MLPLQRQQPKLSRHAQAAIFRGPDNGLITSKSADSCAGYLFIAASQGLFGALRTTFKADVAPSDREHPTSCCRLALTPEKTAAAAQTSYSTLYAERKELIRNTNSPRLLLMGTVE